ncbi:MAG: tetratricopeptide repeat protein, partial [Planctomycetota bacterium]
FSSGHALIGRSAGAIRPALCPHTDLASLELLRAYAEVTGGVRSLDTLLETYPADAFFIDHRRLLGSPLLDALLFGERFALVYLDGRSAVFLARGGRTAALAKHLELDLAALARDPEEGFRFLDEERARAQTDLGWSGWIQRITGQSPPPVPRDRVSLSLLLLAAERPHAAHALASRAYELLPEWPATSYALGVSARAVGRFDEAKHHLRRVARATPNLAEPRHMLGLLHIELGELGRGIEALEAAVRLEPNNARYAQNLRLAYRMAGRKTEAAAVKILGAGQEARAARALERFHEAASLAGAKRDAEAEHLYRAALALDPTLQVAYYNLGNLMFRRRRYSEALMNYRTALDLRPGDLEARYFLALTLDRLGRADEAKSELRAILAVQSDHKAARGLLGRLGAAAAGGAE